VSGAGGGGAGESFREKRREMKSWKGWLRMCKSAFVNENDVLERTAVVGE
jgi:hypothetical protein